MAILRNHGLLTVGTTVDCGGMVVHHRRAHLPGPARRRWPPASPCRSIDDHAALTHGQVGSELAGQFSFHPLYEWIVAEEPDLLD